MRKIPRKNATKLKIFKISEFFNPKTLITSISPNSKISKKNSIPEIKNMNGKTSNKTVGRFNSVK